MIGYEKETSQGDNFPCAALQYDVSWCCDKLKANKNT